MRSCEIVTEIVLRFIYFLDVIGGLFHRHMIIYKLFYLLYTSFMLNDQSTDSVVLKAKLQQQMYT